MPDDFTQKTSERLKSVPKWGTDCRGGWNIARVRSGNDDVYDAVKSSNSEALEVVVVSLDSELISGTVTIISVVG